VLPENVDALVAVARSTTIPIATGERLYTRWGFREVLEKQAARVLQPDLCHAGGIGEVRKIAAMAEVYYAAIAPTIRSGPSRWPRAYRSMRAARTSCARSRSRSARATWRSRLSCGMDTSIYQRRPAWGYNSTTTRWRRASTTGVGRRHGSLTPMTGRSPIGSG